MPLCREGHGVWPAFDTEFIAPEIEQADFGHGPAGIDAKQKISHEPHHH